MRASVNLSIRMLIVSVVAAGIGLAGSPSAMAASGVFLEDVADNQILIPGERIVVLECWDRRITTWLMVRKAGAWKRVASSGGTANSKSCAKGDYLATYKWTVNTLAPEDSSGTRFLQLATSAGPRYTYPQKVQMMTAEEYDYYYSSTSDSPQPTSTPAPVAAPTPVTASAPTSAPAPAPSPLYSMTAGDTAYVSRLWDVAKVQPDKQLSRCRSLASPVMDADSREFYDLGAWSGEQLYKLTRQGALIATKLAYAVYCKGEFGILTRTL